MGKFGEEILVNKGSDQNDLVIVGVLTITSVVGIFASQIATKMWERVSEELELEIEQVVEEVEDEPEWGIVTKLFDTFPFIQNSVVAFDEAAERLESVIDEEVNNATSTVIPDFVSFFDLGKMTTESLVLSPLLWKTLLEKSAPERVVK